MLSCCCFLYQKINWKDFVAGARQDKRTIHLGDYDLLMVRMIHVQWWRSFFAPSIFFPSYLLPFIIIFLSLCSICWANSWFRTLLYFTDRPNCAFDCLLDKVCNWLWDANKSQNKTCTSPAIERAWEHYRFYNITRQEEKLTWHSMIDCDWIFMFAGERERARFKGVFLSYFAPISWAFFLSSAKVIARWCCCRFSDESKRKKKGIEKYCFGPIAQRRLPSFLYFPLILYFVLTYSTILENKAWF